MRNIVISLSTWDVLKFNGNRKVYVFLQIVKSMKPFGMLHFRSLNIVLMQKSKSRNGDCGALYLLFVCCANRIFNDLKQEARVC